MLKYADYVKKQLCCQYWLS